MGLDSRAEQWIQERIRIHGCSSLVINGLRTEFHARDALGVTREHDTAMIAGAASRVSRIREASRRIEWRRTQLTL